MILREAFSFMAPIFLQPIHGIPATKIGIMPVIFSELIFEVGPVQSHDLIVHGLSNLHTRNSGSKSIVRRRFRRVFNFIVLNFFSPSLDPS
jgi:hypothetical protein